MQVGIVLSALRRHRMATFLIAMEIALASAVLCNAIFLMIERRNAMQLVSGLDEQRLGIIQLDGFDPEKASDINARVVQALRGLSGVQSVGLISAVPFGSTGVRAGVNLDQEQQIPGGVLDFYLMDPSALDALQVRLVAGRLPGADEFAPITDYVPVNAPIVITRELAERYWPGESAIGKSLWAMDTRLPVIGVVDHLAVSRPGRGEAKGSDWSVIVPASQGARLAGRYLVRAEPADMQRVMRDAQAAIRLVAPDVVFDIEGSRRISELRERHFESDRVMLGLLAGVIVALLAATALGIVGLASYWVEQRRRQIGIRRALGATRTDIMRYFQIENFLIVSLGVCVGVLLAYLMNLTLMRFYELPRLPLYYIPVSAVILLLLGQAAVLVPALRAAAITPVAAIRSL
jgi:putative ABC transport system permease protein